MFHDTHTDPAHSHLARRNQNRRWSEGPTIVHIKRNQDETKLKSKKIDRFGESLTLALMRIQREDSPQNPSTCSPCWSHRRPMKAWRERTPDAVEAAAHRRNRSPPGVERESGERQRQTEVELGRNSGSGQPNPFAYRAVNGR